ncbi:MAG TPA: 4Fe-4S dicluster domain-containing protein [Chloroflexi bacterium]|nr:4Fe-4S dicluster domain-containing protein [Chloroflexota bacterium]
MGIINMAISLIILVTFSILIFTAGAAFLVLSLIEKEKRAAVRAAMITVPMTAIYLLALLLPDYARYVLIAISLASVVAGGILFLLPTKAQQVEFRQPTDQVDEREIIFARARLEPGTPLYESYYRDHPLQKSQDDASREQTGLLSPHARFMDPLHRASAVGSFTLTEALREAVDGPISDEKNQSSVEDLTKTVKKLAKYYGALDCGITVLKPAHIYSHIGRGTGKYGDKVNLNHTFAIAFTVEMDFEMTGYGPYAPEVMESARQYVESARVSIQLAAAIRDLGFPARAHIDGNYRVIAPLVARDAGLGEIGRMGLLMTPLQGPRVRVGVVTTEMPLDPDSYRGEPSILDFCRICKKCAHNCPSQSIPKGEREISNGVLRWKINPESCYHYWTIAGTDCGRCLAVCPYSHPDNLLHNLVRWGIRRSGNFRKVALLLDDFFYGKNPPSRGKTFLP